jgi:hypothetical protein
MDQPSNTSDWRIDNARRTRGASLKRTQYRAKSASWEHEHCQACWAKFMENGPADTLKEGYVTTEGDRWICPECFDDLREAMTWTLVTS